MQYILNLFTSSVSFIIVYKEIISVHTIIHKMKFKLYPIKKINLTKEQIENDYEEYSLKKTKNILLTENKGYNQRIDSNKSYTFFIDCDSYKGGDVENV